ncbi:MAG: RNA-binding S4 domain-containing protein [Prevotellaceae bacterium]|jgi:ribosome-associated protein|nr:RNA-binding S4 domain-containing protein [Prevotellaceae bacterium]
MHEFQLHPDEEFIPLIQLLKAAHIAYSGGEAQQMVMDGMVTLNGQAESRKRAKIRRGDIVQMQDVTIKVV